MATANERLIDLFLQRQIRLNRMTRSEATTILRLLRESDNALDGFLQRQSGSFAMRRMRKALREIRGPALRQVEARIAELMQQAAAQEAQVTQQLVNRVLPLEVQMGPSAPPPVGNMPFGDPQRQHTLNQWMSQLRVADENRILGAVQAGMTQGATVPQIAQSVQAAAAVTRNHADAIARTAINHASNVAREKAFTEMNDVMKALRWTSTLDGRTSPVCRGRDGQMKPTAGYDWKDIPEPHLPGDVSPPAHIRCRSTLIGVLDSGSVADQLQGQDRATVRDTRTGRQQQIDFKRMERQTPGWSTMSRAERLAVSKRIRDDWAAQYIGRVPAVTRYPEWLRSQPRSFVNEVMGPTRAKLFLSGKLRMEQFVDQATGRQYTLAKLRELYDLS